MNAWVVQDQYPAYQIQAHVPQHGPKYEHKNVPFEGTTTNQDAYKAYAVEPHRAMHAPVVARPQTKFEGRHNSVHIVLPKARLSQNLSLPDWPSVSWPCLVMWTELQLDKLCSCVGTMHHQAAVAS